MSNSKTVVSPDLKKVYDNYYDDSLEEWREIGAIQKVENIFKVCQEQQFTKVLEIGSGSGIILKKIGETDFAKELTAIDISESSIEQIKKKEINKLVDVSTFDGYNTKYNDKEFDLVILSHVLEHAEHPRMLLREIKRISKHLVIEVPRDYKSGVDRRWESLTDYGHINLYTPTLLRFLLKTEGFEIVQDHMSLTCPELLRYDSKNKPFVSRLKTEFFLFARTIAYSIFPMWRKETMINAYTAFCKT